jgi:hypothetical protein
VYIRRTINTEKKMHGMNNIKYKKHYNLVQLSARKKFYVGFFPDACYASVETAKVS